MFVAARYCVSDTCSFFKKSPCPKHVVNFEPVSVLYIVVLLSGKRTLGEKLQKKMPELNPPKAEKYTVLRAKK